MGNETQQARASEMASQRDSQMEIDRLVDSFFALFSNRNGARPNLDGIFELFVPQGIIAKIANQEAEISTLKDSFRRAWPC